MTEYRLLTEWRIPAALPDVWQAIYDSSSWPIWWRCVERVVDLERGDAQGLGASQRLVWKGALPYRVTFDTRVTRVEPMRLLEGWVSGELEGVGRWRFEPRDGLTVVRYEWQVRTTRPWMNWLAPLARPLFVWNHDRVMRAGGRGLVHYLAAARAEKADCRGA